MSEMTVTDKLSELCESPTMGCYAATVGKMRDKVADGGALDEKEMKLVIDLHEILQLDKVGFTKIPYKELKYFGNPFKRAKFFREKLGLR